LGWSNAYAMSENRVDRGTRSVGRPQNRSRFDSIHPFSCSDNDHHQRRAWAGKSYRHPSTRLADRGNFSGASATPSPKISIEIVAAAVGSDARAHTVATANPSIAMTEKLPVPCQHCHASGLKAGVECRECGGKGYRLLVNGRELAPRRQERVQQRPRHRPVQQQWQRSR
jgi:hypothetical protein